MTGDKNLFMELKAKSGGEVTFGDNSKGHIEGIGCIGNNSSTLIENVLLVGGLKHCNHPFSSEHCSCSGV